MQTIFVFECAVVRAVVHTLDPLRHTSHTAHDQWLRGQHAAPSGFRTLPDGSCEKLR